MTSQFNSMIAFPVTRAQRYPHTWPDDPSPEAAPIVDLHIDRLAVDTEVVPGMVTLAASTRDASRDAYGSEYDLAPTDARALGRQLMAAADECERADQADGLGVRELHELQGLQAARQVGISAPLALDVDLAVS